jgi:hypothetical protein
MDMSNAIIETYWQAVQGAGADVSSNVSGNSAPHLTARHSTKTCLPSDEMTSLYPERFVVQSLLLLKSTMGNWASASPIEVSPDFVRQFAELIVTRLLPLRQVDLEKWADDPEEWMNEEEADRWEYELRVSCEPVGLESEGD